MDEVIAKLYIEAIGIFIVSIIYLVVAIRKKRWIKWEKMAPDIKHVVKRNEKKINILLKLFIGLCLVLMCVITVVPAVKDFPNVIYEKYLIVEGKVVSWDYSNEDKKQSRSIEIIDSKTNRKVNVVVYSTGIHKGERLKVTYLPNSKFGIVEERK